jgi:NAD-dependent DNA ligase
MSAAAGFIFVLALLPVLRAFIDLLIKALLPVLFNRPVDRSIAVDPIITTDLIIVDTTEDTMSGATTTHKGAAKSQLVATETASFTRETLLKGSEEQLCRWIEVAIQDYTLSQTGTTWLTDAQYDDLVQAVLTRFPHRKEWLDAVQVLSAPGSCSSTPTKTVATTRLVPDHWPMTSLAKAHTDDELRAFLVNHRPPGSALIVQPKLDGQSVQIVFEGPGTTKMYTRMKPRGQDISFLLPFLRLAPGTLLMVPDVYPCSVRGELILSEHWFNVCKRQHDPTAVNARNVLSGVVNGAIAHHRDHEEWSPKETFLFGKMDLVLYSILVPEELPYKEQHHRLKTWLRTDEWEVKDPQLKLVDQLVVENTDGGDDQIREMLTFTKLEAKLKEWRSTLPWFLDGLALKWADAPPRLEQAVDGSWRNPKTAIAFKVREGGVPGIVERVEWNETRNGILFPRVKLTESVRVGNVSIQYATGVNAAFIHDNNIMPGTVVEIIHSGSTIPEIRGVISHPLLKDVVATAFPPAGTWVWGESNVHIYRQGAGMNKALLVKQLHYICQVFELKDVGLSTLTALVESGVVVDMDGFYALGRRGRDDNLDDLVKVKGMGKIKSLNVVTQIKRVVETVMEFHTMLGQGRVAVLGKLMATCGVFGAGLGYKQALSVLMEASGKRVPPPWTEEWLMENVELFGRVRAKQLVENWGVFEAWMARVFPGVDMSLLWVQHGTDRKGEVQPHPDEGTTREEEPSSLPPRRILTVCLSKLRDKDGHMARAWSTPEIRVVTVDTMNKTVNAVVVADMSEPPTGKVKTALEKGLEVMEPRDVSKWVQSQAAKPSRQRKVSKVQ